MTIKTVQELYGVHPNSEIYVVGAGSSLRVFPESFLADKISIGCNMAWRSAPVKYSITIHPDLNVPEFMPGEASHPGITWITKYKKSQVLLSPEQMQHAEEKFYFFEAKGQKNTAEPYEPSDAGRILDWVRRPTGNFLYQWSSISQTAVNLAANMGARTIVLIGCDNGSLLGNHHAHQQHTRWKGVDPNHRYRQYYEGLREVRAALRERGIDVVSMNPFVSLLEPEMDFRMLCNELGRPELLVGGDVAVPEAKKTQSVGEKFAKTAADVWRSVSGTHKN